MEPRATGGVLSTLPSPERQCVAPALLDATTAVANSWWVQHVDGSRRAPITLPRSGNHATALVDGEAAMVAIGESLRAAETSIWITDWMLTPNVVLQRDGAGKGETLFTILEKAARRGVQVRVLLYDSVDMMEKTDTGDIEAERILETIPGVRVLRHRPGLKWSHHQKTVIVDGKVAFLGGIDLCVGRWDRPSHTLTPQSSPAPFDAYNPCAPDPAAPRMPWHDVHLRIRGPAVHDVALNFFQRWQSHSVHTLERPLAPLPEAPPRPAGRHWVQIIRSISSDAGGGPRTELSIYEAYLRAIQNAQHCIYIENQFFVSRCELNGSVVENDVAGAIARRVIRAIDEKATFRVVLIIPAHPEGPVAASTTLEVLRLQMNTLRSLMSAIAARLGDQGKPEDYVSVFYLRASGDLPTGAVTEQIYVHTKLMIVDDSVVIVGSANINDRSLLGNRDSEIAAIVVDEDARPAPMGGKPRMVRTFARNLRKQLWKEHFGRELDDPLGTHAELAAIGRATAAAYENAFPHILSDRHATVATQTVAQTATRAGAAGAPHAVAYPLGWLRDQWPRDEKVRGLFKDVYAEAPGETHTA